jgi:hypothetical protein
MLVIVILAVILDVSWKRLRARRELASDPVKTITEDGGGDTSLFGTGPASVATP